MHEHKHTHAHEKPVLVIPSFSSLKPETHEKCQHLIPPLLLTQHVNL